VSRSVKYEGETQKKKKGLTKTIYESNIFLFQLFKARYRMDPPDWELIFTDDLTPMILSFLTIQEIANVAVVCKVLKEIITEQDLLMKRLRLKYGVVTDEALVAHKRIFSMLPIRLDMDMIGEYLFCKLSKLDLLARTFELTVNIFHAEMRFSSAIGAIQWIDKIVHDLHKDRNPWGPAHLKLGKKDLITEQGCRNVMLISKKRISKSNYLGITLYDLLEVPTVSLYITPKTSVVKSVKKAVSGVWKKLSG